MSGYERLKRYRERQSFERELAYLAKNWAELGTDPKTWTARQCASRKRWFIYYMRRRRERESGYPLGPHVARHWVGRAEAEHKRGKRDQGAWNMSVLRHLARF